MYKYMSYELKDKMDDASGVYFREPDVPREVLQIPETSGALRTSGCLYS